MRQTETPGTEAAPRPRLRWWTELPLILLVYGCYSAGRLLARGDVSSAVDHGLAILRIEQLLHLDAEHPLNRLFTREPWLGVPADFWYASLHYLVTPAILVWLFRSHAARYRAARTWLMTSTFIGLIGFTLLPTCPPRLLHPGHGFTDTMAYYSSYGWWGGEASAPRGMGGMTNQYAAMPSLHVGWALFCGVMLWRYGRGPLARAGAVIYPLFTALVVMGTANHYLLDAVAGAAVMGAGLLLAPYVLRAADAVKARLSLAGAAPAGVLSPVVSGGCQTSAGERIPRQRESRVDPPAGPDASPSGAGDGTPAPAR
ncbi:phosphatase PAP2 family protein [Streptomyces sp. NPDC003656]|uniref:phosphatase PAP2 family protein n=1 Tax=Streptomyces sp. DSM 110735 TaxID=2775031 RepID=UPI0018F73E17|nr:phosphatase PAP2 family protein [Streptomyces sp. DSM 110735]MBJ7905106.1 phosphatase PAP2 family protein [Streptomyces sp. DSM 110735]